MSNGKLFGRVALILIVSLFAVNSTIFSQELVRTITKSYPILPLNPANYGNSWKASLFRTLSMRAFGSDYFLMTAFIVTGFSGQTGAGPFRNVSHSYAFDVNKDGRADLVNYTYDGRIVIKINQGNGQFVDQFDYNAAGFLAASIADDFNNDGKVDMVGMNGKTVYFMDNLERNSTQIYSRGNIRASDPDFQASIVTTWMTTYDFDNDGFKDIIFADRRGRVWFWRNDPTQGVNRFFNESQIFLLVDTGLTTVNPGIAQQGGVVDMYDVNYDNIPDIVVGNIQRREIRIYLGVRRNNRIEYPSDNYIVVTDPSGRIGPTVELDGRSANSKSPHYLTSFTPTLLKFADVDADGYVDLYVATDAWGEGRNYGGALYIFKGNGFTPDGKPKFLSYELSAGNSASSGQNPYDFDAGGVADFDGDGILDFVAADGNHSGNFYHVKTVTLPQYNTSDYGLMLTNEMWEVLGLNYSDIPRNYIERLEIEIEFDRNRGNGYFEVRYYDLVRSMSEVFENTDPLRWKRTGVLFPGTGQDMLIATTVPANGVFRASIQFPRRVRPSLRVLLALKALNATTSPAIRRITYTARTGPAQIEVKNFNWISRELRR